MPDFHQIPLPAGVEPAAATVNLVFTEGPACDADGTLYFSDIRNNRILKWREGGAVEVFRDPSRRRRRPR